MSGGYVSWFAYQVAVDDARDSLFLRIWNFAYEVSLFMAFEWEL